MTATNQINAALESRGMLPMDGFCVCGRCSAYGLNRDDMADPATLPYAICKKCLSMLLDGYRKCGHCTAGTSVAYDWHLYRQEKLFCGCSYCNGAGVTYQGVPAELADHPQANHTHPTQRIGGRWA